MRLIPKIELHASSSVSSPEIIKKREQLMLDYPNSVSKEERDFLKTCEAEKSSDEIEALGRIDDLTNEWAVRYGGTAFHLPAARVHLLTGAGYRKKFRNATSPVGVNHKFGSIYTLELTRADPHILLFFLLEGFFERRA